LKKLILLFTSVICIDGIALAQLRFSIATDVSLLRNFSPQQKFWSLGQGVEADLHFSQKNTFYGWFNYHTQGSFNNSFEADVKPPGTPGQIDYYITGKWAFRQVSIGWKHYIRGSFDKEYDWNLYGAAGFGLLFTRAENILVSSIDTALYALRPTPQLGKDDFKRLTLDLALGTELPLGPNFYVYVDVRTSIPTSDYPSPLLHNKKHVPLPVMLNAGMRILFGSGE